jgi:hypothetical protein
MGRPHKKRYTSKNSQVKQTPYLTKHKKATKRLEERILLRQIAPRHSDNWKVIGFGDKRKARNSRLAKRLPET